MKNNLLLFAVVLLVSCSESTKISNKDIFPESISLSPQKMEIEGDMNLVDIVFSDNYMILVNEEKSDGNQLFVYDKKAYSLLYSFLRHGHGANEGIAVDLVQNPTGDTIKVIDQAKYKILTYILMPDKAKLISEDYLKLEASGPLQEIYTHNDSLIVFFTLDNTIYSYNMKSGQVVDSFRFPHIFTSATGQERMNAESFHLAYFNNKLCAGFNHINCLVNGHVDTDGQIAMDSDKVKEQVTNIPAREASERMYYAFVDLNDSLIVAEYKGTKLSKLKRTLDNFLKLDFSFELECYSSNLMPKLHITPNGSILRCKIDKKDNLIYSWDPLSENLDLCIFTLDD